MSRDACEKIRSLFVYSDGKLLWAARKQGVKIGSEAGCDWVDSRRRSRMPRRQIRFDGSLYFRSRLVWIYHNGDIPEGLQVDHIDGNCSNDRIENLRLATSTENNWNKGKTSQNKSGVKGVRFLPHLKSKPWFARARVNGVMHNLGYFATAELAKAAYDALILKAHGQFANTGEARGA